MQTRKLIIFTVLCTVTLIKSSPQEIDYKGFTQWSWQQEGNTEYMLYTPSDTVPGMRYPLAVFLHGCCGEDDHATLRNAVDPPARMWHNFGENTQTEPIYIISPKTTRGWEQKFPDIKAAIDKLIAAGKVDERRIYMTGFSMGGAGTWQFMETYPGYLAAAIPMGMRARAKLEQVKNTPIWAIRGEDDWFSQVLDEQIDTLRKLNGDTRGPQEWVTGVNPMFTNFEGVGHGVQWDAASTLPLVAWALSKINDGNIYPVVMILSPADRTSCQPGETVTLKVSAHDPDGTIAKIRILVDKQIAGESDRSPCEVTIRLSPGDHDVEATALDDKGKTSTDRILLQADIEPAFNSSSLPEVSAGSYYHQQLSATGNQPLSFSLNKDSQMPVGLTMDERGLILGIPIKSGEFDIAVTLSDADEDNTSRTFRLVIKPKKPDEVLITGVRYPHDSLQARVSKMMPGELPNTQAGTEVSFSDIGYYEGLTYISTSQDAANLEADSLLSFTVDEDVTVYVAYERHDRLFTSTIPAWLKEYKKEGTGQITAQYHYFDVYSRNFPAGQIVLPGAAADKNNVLRNYFVMVRKKMKV